MSLFRVEHQEDGVFTIRTQRDDEEVCSVVFEEGLDMGGALEAGAQKTLMLQFTNLMQRACIAHWRREGGE